MEMMKKSCIHKKITKSIAATILTLAVLSSFVPMATMAAAPRAYPYTQLRRVKGEGVRLRAAAYNGTILELMYSNDLFWADERNLSDQIGNGWIHGQRDSTRTIGYVKAHFVGY